MVGTAKSRMSWLYVHLIPQANSTLYSRYILKVQWFVLKTTLFNFFFFFQIQILEKYSNRGLSDKEMAITAKSRTSWLYVRSMLYVDDKTIPKRFDCMILCFWEIHREITFFFITTRKIVKICGSTVINENNRKFITIKLN